MKRRVVFGLILVSGLVLARGTTTTEGADGAKCTMRFNLQGWSAFYETASGGGTITCSNKQSARVKIEVKGGGITAGKTTMRGTGTFSEVSEMKELFGSYATAEAHAGVVKSAGAQVLTKGSVSLALKATGSGFDLGIAFGKFTIQPVGKKSGK
jgi:hypothetical protein